MGLIQALKNSARLYPLQKQLRQRMHEGKEFAREYLKLEEIVDSAPDETVDEKAYRKMYSMATALSMVGRGYADLIGINPSVDQMKVEMLVGALAIAQDRLCDDLEERFPEETLDLLYNDPANYTPISSADSLAKDLYQRLLEIMPKEQFPNYHETLKKLHDIQKTSRIQKSIKIDSEKIWEISLQKGTYALLAVMHALNPTLTPNDSEYQAIA
jgi:hypothetical protein